MRGDNTAWERLWRKLCVDRGINPDLTSLHDLEMLNAQEIEMPYPKRLSAYGMGFDSYVDTFNRQDGRCAICHVEPAGKYPDILVVDHNHSTTEHTLVRGLLCQRCNIALGLLRDDVAVLESAIAYLKRPASVYLAKRQRQVSDDDETRKQWAALDYLLDWGKEA